MKQVLIGAMQVIVGTGLTIFLTFAVAATVLIYFHFQDGHLAWERGGPEWGYGKIALVCGCASAAWGGLWRRLPRVTLEKGTKEPRPVSSGAFAAASS